MLQSVPPITPPAIVRTADVAINPFADAGHPEAAAEFEAWLDVRESIDFIEAMEMQSDPGRFAI